MFAEKEIYKFFFFSFTCKNLKEIKKTHLVILSKSFLFSNFLNYFLFFYPVFGDFNRTIGTHLDNTIFEWKGSPEFRCEKESFLSLSGFGLTIHFLGRHASDNQELVSWFQIDSKPPLSDSVNTCQYNFRISIVTNLDSYLNSQGKV